jgi:hypothetical protein
MSESSSVTYQGIAPAPAVTQATSGSTDTETEKVWSGYKAILKEETETIEIPGIASVVISGCTYDTDFNGTYILVDDSAIGTNRVWKNENNKYLAFSQDSENWCLYAELNGMFFYNNYYPDYPNHTIPENPWDAEHWENTFGDSDVPVFTVTQTGGTTETKTVKYYEFEETLTEGLTYGAGFTPVIGKVYDREAMVEAKLKQASITKTAIFTEAFNGSISDKFTVLNEDPQFTNISGKSCMLVDHAHRLSMPCSNFPRGNAPRSIAANLYFNTLYDYSFYVGYGGDDSNTFNICTQSNYLENYHKNMSTSLGSLVPDKWYHIVMTFDGITMKCYIDGLLSGQYTYTYNTNVADYPLYVGYLATQSREFYQNGYIANLSVYDRALTEEEIQQLYQEF